ncbi:MULTISPECIES: hypothetical protein [unclassified Algibacter]|uniref:hypothetical protein n=1 Tax=unclassified Algibacter TaxID=2615009 RepID=UPI00131B73FF|nr:MULTISPECIES: hypothetical protein [unclassified Algibacter]MCL5127793.1 hypothetical protein [Algibacter sp. L4_22]
MHKKLRLLIPVSLLFFKTGYTQNLEKTKKQVDLSSYSFIDRTEFKASYFGNIFWNNGLTIGAEYLWIEKDKIKHKRKGIRTNKHQFLLTGNLGFTSNFSSKTDTGVFTNYGVTWRRTNKKGKQFSIELNPLGYYRSFLPETYKVTGNNVEKVSLPGRGYYAPSISVGIGKERPGKKITGRYFNINFMLRTPYNAGSLPAFNFEYGYRFNFKKKKRDAESN